MAAPLTANPPDADEQTIDEALDAAELAVREYHNGDREWAKEWAMGPIDVLVGGPPCQSFSVAGLRKSLDDDRGNLSLQWVLLKALAANKAK